jgi:hypothetical protein
MKTGTGKQTSAKATDAKPATANTAAANESSASPTPPGPGQPTSQPHTTFDRVRAFASQHPAGAVVAAAGAGALYAAELAVGALDGIAGARLFRKKSAPELCAELRRQRADLLEQAKPQRERLYQQGQRLLQHGHQLRQRGEILVERGKALWPFPRRPSAPKPVN